MMKVKQTAKRAEVALRELILEGRRINQAAVEKRAGLSNGTLNYDTQAYKEIKERIVLAKQDTSSSTQTSYSTRKSGELKKQIELKNKYRQQRDEARIHLKKSLGEQAELIHHTITMQKYIAHLEQTGKASGVVVNMNSHRSQIE